MHPLLRKWKAASLRLVKQWKAGLRRLVAWPRSLERLLLFTIAGVMLFSIIAIALTSLGLLRDQASDQALSKVRAAAHAARYEIRRVGEDTVTAARLLASRATLARLVEEGNVLQLQLVLRRFCETAGLDACALFRDTGLVTSAGSAIPWEQAFDAAAEQGEGFMIASRQRGPVGALVEIPGLAGGRVMTIRKLDDRLADELSKQVGVEIHLLPVTDWLEFVEPAYRDMHSEALATGDIAVAPIPAREQFAASLPLFASTGEAIVLIEARLPAEQVAGAVSSSSAGSCSCRSCWPLSHCSPRSSWRAGSVRRCRRSRLPRRGLGRVISLPPSRHREPRKSRRSRARWRTCGGTSWI